jgi:hypothetical protein
MNDWQSFYKAMAQAQFGPDTPIGDLKMVRAILSKELQFIKALITLNVGSNDKGTNGTESDTGSETRRD